MHDIQQHSRERVTINDFHARGKVITRKQFISTIVDTRYRGMDGRMIKLGKL